MIERRFFLKLTGCLVAGSALEALPVLARAYADDAPGAAGVVGTAVVEAPPPILQAPGTYRITGRVRLQEPLVEISGITNAHQISWSAGAISSPVATFTSFEHFEQPWQMPEIQVRGGQLEALSVVPLDFG
jgi:hypothetical protein